MTDTGGNSSVFAAAHQGVHQFEMRRKNSFSKLSGAAAARSMAGMYLDEPLPTIEPQKSRIFNLMASYTPTDMTTIQKRIVNHVEYTLARTRFNFGEEDCYRATAYSIRDRLIETLNDTNSFFFEKDLKRCYYLSLEFLVGRAMQNALVNLDLEDNYKKALQEMGYNLEALYEYEHDAALGNGGLGRLAACFLDSMATSNYPCWGYGIRYTYGIFEQKIISGRQVEHPDYWLVQDNPWEIPRHDITYGVRFYGEVKQVSGSAAPKYRWSGGQLIQAVAYDTPIPGFDTYNCINLRLWKSAPSREFDFKSFNAGKYLDAVAERQDAECISAVLYPNDDSEEGKLLRLKQQYFFCCATIQDVLRRFKLKHNRDWSELPSKITLQLNDTHPTIAIPELMRILVDIENVDWEFAWSLTRQVFNYTNHTVLPEALEKWPADLLGRLLPRHLLIINDINFHFLTDVRNKMGDVWDKVAKMSIYAEGCQKMIRMANLAIIGSHKVNGVAAIHSDIVKRDIFPEFCEYYKLCGDPHKFINVTNGVTPRRWIYCANRPLSNLISEWLGCDGWLKDLDMLQGLHAHVDDEQFVSEWAKVKLRNKKRLAKYIDHHLNVKVDPQTMLFDIQVKRIHEYKRQALNCFHMIHRYLTLKRMSLEEREKKVVPRVTVIGGKAAPGYATAKTIIKMVNSIATIVNNDPDMASFYKVVFLPNYNVSQAMLIVPAADINQQISTAGMEASGTSNMKFVMNGSLIVGTMDGATVEICEECGEDTMFIFGAREHEIKKIRENARQGQYPVDPRLQDVFNWIRGGHLALGDMEAQAQFTDLVQQIEKNGDGHNGDYYLICHDFPSYVRTHEEADAAYRDRTEWTKRTIKAAASMGKFTTDRTIREYATLIWNLEAAERPLHQKTEPKKEEATISSKATPPATTTPATITPTSTTPATITPTTTTPPATTIVSESSSSSPPSSATLIETPVTKAVTTTSPPAAAASVCSTGATTPSETKTPPVVNAPSTSAGGMVKSMKAMMAAGTTASNTPKATATAGVSAATTVSQEGTSAKLTTRTAATTLKKSR